MNSEEHTSRVLELIAEEREEQHASGKEDNHGWATWLILFSDYCGRVATALCKLTFGTEKDQKFLERALVKALAVGTAWLEHVIMNNPENTEELLILDKMSGITIIGSDTEE